MMRPIKIYKKYMPICVNGITSSVGMAGLYKHLLQLYSSSSTSEEQKKMGGGVKFLLNSAILSFRQLTLLGPIFQISQVNIKSHVKNLFNIFWYVMNIPPIINMEQLKAVNWQGFLKNINFCLFSIKSGGCVGIVKII